MTPDISRPPQTVEELIPWLEKIGFHLHYGTAQDRWTLVGASKHALKYCAPETCYRLRIKNHREDIPANEYWPIGMREVCCLTCKERQNREDSVRYVLTDTVTKYRCHVCQTVLEHAEEETE